MEGVHLTQHRDSRRALVSTVMNVLFPWNVGKLVD
jgi:hypothetical protein